MAKSVRQVNEDVVPHCGACGYCLEGLAGCRCPECGAPAGVKSSIPTSTSAAAVIAGAAAVLITGLAVVGGVPHWYAPLPLTVLIPMFMGLPHAVVAIAWSLLFVVYARLVWIGRREISNVSIGLFLVAMAMSAVVYVGGFEYAGQYQAPGYSVYVSVAGWTLVALLWTLLVINILRPRHWTNAGFHFVLGVWFVGWAFPYMGELP
ncbi:MAG: hypothetical protein ACKVW3_04085 [Phycisphaerales bacterium]